ncbi:hypothetical protein [Sporosarcina koreensis]|uniref:hypothetical protein n=1 Tax=Bacillales TaxID=1385 RepID=UPI0007596A9C|nr:hypothetical protein [Sporosarcina koreensis]
MIKLKKVISILLTLSIFTMFTFNGNTASAQDLNNESDLPSLKPVSNSERDLEAFFDESSSFINAIEVIPDSVLEEGPNAIVDWFQANVDGDYQFSTDGVNLIIDSNIAPYILNDQIIDDGIQVFGVAACVGAIGAALVTGILPIAKISKIKNALNAVGGTAKFVNNLHRHYKFNRNKGWSKSKSYDEAFDRATAAYGPEIKTELGALFGITAIYGACFE